MQLDVFPDHIHLRREVPPRKFGRYHMVCMQRNLFGGADLIHEWGWIGLPGRVHIEHHKDEGQALNALLDLATVKQKRGYS